MSEWARPLSSRHLHSLSEISMSLAQGRGKYHGNSCTAGRWGWEVGLLASPVDGWEVAG